MTYQEVKHPHLPLLIYFKRILGKTSTQEPLSNTLPHLHFLYKQILMEYKPQTLTLFNLLISKALLIVFIVILTLEFIAVSIAPAIPLYWVALRVVDIVAINHLLPSHVLLVLCPFVKQKFLYVLKGLKSESLIS